MKSVSITEFKANFHEVIMLLQNEETIAVTDDNSEDVVGYFVRETPRPRGPRQLGILEGKATITFSDDFKMTEDEFLGLA